MASVLLLFAHEAQCGWHDKFLGADVPVHYVHLTGYGGNNDTNRKNITETHKACFSLHMSLGKPAIPLPPEGVPPIISTQDVELYYASNRTLTFKQGTLYDIDGETCALRASPHKVLELRSSAGRCDIDLIRKEAVGQCDAIAHRRAPASVSPGRDGARVPIVDFSKVPPEMRAKVEEQLAKLKRESGAETGMQPAGTGLRKTVAGIACEVHRHEPLQSTLCIAKPVPLPDRPLNPYPIPAASLNGGVPGLLVEAETPTLILHAKEVRLNIAVSEDLFAIAPDVKVRPVPKGPK
ncbi:hypothetical protein EGT07_00460 [Herbaspirillum sp. HC18]|nr:hypothetical protein EGT07_00460 [Herbaspirillum sp. HC18]